MNDFSGLNAVSSGGASGIGLATVRRLSAGDASVAVLDLDPPSVARPIVNNAGVGLVGDVTDRVTHLLTSDDPLAERWALEGRQPHGRLVTADEVAKAICLFAKRGAGSITGTSLAVDGGMQALLVPPVRQ